MKESEKTHSIAPINHCQYDKIMKCSNIIDFSGLELDSLIGEGAFKKVYIGNYRI